MIGKILKPFMRIRDGRRRVFEAQRKVGFQNEDIEPEDERMENPLSKPIEIPHQPSRGMLTICPTPIGNINDITIRQYQAIKSADIIATESTELANYLVDVLKDYTFSKINESEFPPTQTQSLEKIDEISSLKESIRSEDINEFKELKGRGLIVDLSSNRKVSPQSKLVKAMKSGIKVVLVAPNGALISGPSLKLVTEALKNGVSLEALPGPTQAIVAICSSGFPADTF